MDSLMMKLIFFGFIILAVLLEIAGDIFFKEWSVNGKNILFYAGMLIYISGTLFWAFSLKYEYLSKAISIFTVLNLVIVALVGVLYFGEKLSLVNKIGIGLGVLSVILIEI